MGALVFLTFISSNLPISQKPRHGPVHAANAPKIINYFCFSNIMAFFRKTAAQTGPPREWSVRRGGPVRAAVVQLSLVKPI